MQKKAILLCCDTIAIVPTMVAMLYFHLGKPTLESPQQNQKFQCMAQATNAYEEDDYDTMHTGDMNYDLKEEMEPIEGMGGVTPPIWEPYFLGTYKLIGKDRTATLIISKSAEDTYTLYIQSLMLAGNNKPLLTEFACENGIRKENTFVFENFVSDVTFEVSPLALTSIEVVQTEGRYCFLSGEYQKMEEK